MFNKDDAEFLLGHELVLTVANLHAVSLKIFVFHVELEC